MARITLEAVTKDVKNSKTGELVYVKGQTRIRLYDEKDSDGMNLEAFEAVVEQENNWVMINQGFKIDDKLYPSREAKYSTGQIEVRWSSGEARIYEIKDSVIQAFANVAGQTRINLREMELRKLNEKAAA